MHLTDLLGILLLLCACSAQAWAKKCHDQLRGIKEELKSRRP